MSTQESLYQQIREYLEILIAQNQSVPGYRLPSENQLAKRFGSSRIPAKQALQQLEAEGLVYRQKGRGTFIADRDSAVLTTHRHYTFCLMLPRMNITMFDEIAAGIRSVLEQRGDELYIVITDDDIAKETQLLRAAINRKFDGILIFPVVNHTYNDALLELTLKRFPVIMLGRSLPGLKLCCVYSDHYEQAYGGTRYLIERGHRSIAMLIEAADIASTCAERIRGYNTCVMEYLGAQAINLAEINFFQSPDVNGDLNDAIDRLMRRKPTAILTCHQALRHISDYLHQHHLDVQLLCFDREERSAFFHHKPIIIDQNPVEIGRRATELLYARIEQQAPIQDVVIDYHILDEV